MSATRIVQAVRPHIPLIKFRSGGLRKAAPQVELPRAPLPSPSSSSSIQPVSFRPSNAPEFFQLDRKYHRTELTQEEIDFINRGGPD